MFHLTKKDFQEKVLSGEGAAVVMFYEKWCPNCSMTRPLVEETEEKYRGRVSFYEVEITEEPTLAAAYKVDLVPAFLFVKRGRLTGYMKGIPGEKTLEKRIGELL